MLSEATDIHLEGNVVKKKIILNNLSISKIMVKWDILKLFERRFESTNLTNINKFCLKTRQQRCRLKKYCRSLVMTINFCKKSKIQAENPSWHVFRQTTSIPNIQLLCHMSSPFHIIFTLPSELPLNQTKRTRYISLIHHFISLVRSRFR